MIEGEDRVKVWASLIAFYNGNEAQEEAIDILRADGRTESGKLAGFFKEAFEMYKKNIDKSFIAPDAENCVRLAIEFADEYF